MEKYADILINRYVCGICEMETARYMAEHKKEYIKVCPSCLSGNIPKEILESNNGNGCGP